MVAGISDSKSHHLLVGRRPQFLTGCWSEVSIPYDKGLSMGRLVVLKAHKLPPQTQRDWCKGTGEYEPVRTPDSSRSPLCPSSGWGTSTSTYPVGRKLTLEEHGGESVRKWTRHVGVVTGHPGGRLPQPTTPFFSPNRTQWRTGSSWLRKQGLR